MGCDGVDCHQLTIFTAVPYKTGKLAFGRIYYDADPPAAYDSSEQKADE
jgi:hypothetical protein